MKLCPSDLTLKAFKRLYDLNIKSVIHVTQLIAKSMIERNSHGSIVILSSQASKVGSHFYSVYSCTKGAIDAFMRAATVELGPHNIRINCVNPTVVLTDMGKLGGWDDPRKAAPFIERIPLQRFPEVQEVVDAVLFLLSEKASMVNGTCVPIEGGYIAG